MKLNKKSKKLIVSVFAASLVVFFCTFNFALAGEISRSNIIYLVNQSRTENGLEPLAENQKLDKAAEEKLADMFKNDYFAHTSPSGASPWFWVEKNGYDYQYAGENLALGFTTVENEHKAWMESPTHRKNILNPNYKEIGVAIGSGKINGSTVTLAVQTFGALAEYPAGAKKENNIPDDKSKELLDKIKKGSSGVVLNTEDSNSNSNGKFNGIFQSGDSGLKANSQYLSKFRELVFQDRTFLRKYIWLTSFLILSFLIVFNILGALIIIFHEIVHHLRKKREVFMLVNSLFILILLGAVIF
ncbi:MAG: CAP domain-containing protein [bacterium]|nr:CAP domain-containing protein [bacterium]